MLSRLVLLQRGVYWRMGGVVRSMTCLLLLLLPLQLLLLNLLLLLELDLLDLLLLLEMGELRRGVRAGMGVSVRVLRGRCAVDRAKAKSGSTVVHVITICWDGGVLGHCGQTHVWGQWVWTGRLRAPRMSGAGGE